MAELASILYTYLEIVVGLAVYAAFVILFFGYFVLHGRRKVNRGS